MAKDPCGTKEEAELCVLLGKMTARAEDAEARCAKLEEALLRRIARERLVTYPSENPGSYMSKVVRGQLLGVMDKELASLAEGEKEIPQT